MSGVGEGNEWKTALLKMRVAEIENLTGQLECARVRLKRAEEELARS